MNVIKYSLGSMLVALIAGLGLSGCGEAKELYNCGQICRTAGTCADQLNMDMDMTQCIGQCEDAGDQQPDFAQTASDCRQCLEGVDQCGEAFPCATECAGVLPAMLWGEQGNGGEPTGTGTPGGEGGTTGETTGGEGGGTTTTTTGGAGETTND